MEKKQNWFCTLLGFTKGERIRFVLSILLSIISIVAGLVPYFCIYKIISFIVEGSLTSYLIIKWLLIALLFFLVKVVFFSLSTYLSHHMAFNVIKGLRRRIADKFLHAPLGVVQKYSIGEIKNIIVDKTENIEPPLAHIVPEGAGHIMLPILSIIALFFIDWRIALSSLVTLPIAIVCMGLTFWISGKNFTKYNESNAYMSSTIVEYIEGIEVIKAFGRSGVSYEKYASSIKDYKTFVLKWMSSTWVTMKLAFAVFPSTILGTLPVSLYLCSQNIISIPLVALSIMLSMSMVTSLAKIEVFSESIRQMEETVYELNDYLSLPFLREPSDDNNLNISSYDVEMDNVHFSYKDDIEVLHGLSLKLPQSSFTALVGPSGSGKSTVAKLLARFWDVDRGEIKIGGINIKNMTLSTLSSLVSFVTQDNFLFQTSILENIRMGNPNASDEDVMKAAKEAQCEEFINKLPNGYNTMAGEAGKRLSGGEKQRIAIARMMLKNAPIVILDEATAFTDPENEDKIQQSIQRLTKDKTLLVIAHRLSTIKNADNIVVLDNGSIVDMGKQNELLERCELYKNMWLSHIGAKEWAVTSKGGKE